MSFWVIHALSFTDNFRQIPLKENNFIDLKTLWEISIDQSYAQWRPYNTVCNYYTLFQTSTYHETSSRQNLPGTYNQGELLTPWVGGGLGARIQFPCPWCWNTGSGQLPLVSVGRLAQTYSLQPTQSRTHPKWVAVQIVSSQFVSNAGTSAADDNPCKQLFQRSSRRLLVNKLTSMWEYHICLQIIDFSRIFTFLSVKVISL